MLYKLYKGKFTKNIEFMAREGDTYRLKRSALKYHAKIKLIKLFDITLNDSFNNRVIKSGSYYIIHISSSFLMFKLRAWLFNRKIAKMKKLHEQGMTYRKIAKIMGCTYQNVFYLVNKRD